MSALEVNKILAAILLAILVIVVISHLGDLIVNINAIFAAATGIHYFIKNGF